MNTNPYFTGCRYVLALLSGMLFLGFTSTGQVNYPEQQSASLKNDTTLINQYFILYGKAAKHAPDSAIKLLNSAYLLAKKHSLPRKIGRIWCLMAEVNVSKGNFKISKSYLDSAFRLGEKTNDGNLICFANMIAAYMYQNSSDFAKAATHFFQALETVQKYNITDSPLLPDLYNNLGGLMFALGENNQAKKYLKLAEYHELQLKPVDSMQLMQVQVNLAHAYINTQSDSAVSYFKKAYQQAKKYDNVPFTFHILLGLSKCYMMQQQFDSSAYYLQLAKKNAANELSLIETEITEAFLAYYKNDRAMAIAHFEKAVALDKGGDHNNIEEAYLGLSELYEERKQFQTAYGYLRKYQDLNEKRMQGNGQQKIVSDFMLHFQSLEHEKSIAAKQAELKARETAIKKRNLWIVAMCLLTALLGIILAMAFRNYRNRKIILNERMQALIQDQEIDQLKAEADGADKERSRIAYDLHDGVMVRLANIKMNLNTLPTALPGFADNKSYLDIMGQLEVTTRELRNTAHNLMPEILLEDGVAEAIFYFCRATEQASGIPIKFQQVGEPLPRLQTHVETALYRITQGLVQNIIKHAQATNCLVQLQYTDYSCAITVEDDGRGFPNSKNQEGYGLKSIRNRIKVLNGTFDIESEEGRGTTAYFEFDVRPFL